ncbi:hypothetical protein ElyMa_005536300 [Elysia marginata]|uniref:Uncharacterized protein n=1 Tax=Elysia marginata TaxID=1093978 RepID=A0AAV4EYK7_9GAST|nr:hypothetical protein ElyMa_005536300 [Elysia marginata]
MGRDQERQRQQSELGLDEVTELLPLILVRVIPLGRGGPCDDGWEGWLGSSRLHQPLVLWGGSGSSVLESVSCSRFDPPVRMQGRSSREKMIQTRLAFLLLFGKFSC